MRTLPALVVLGMALPGCVTLVHRELPAPVACEGAVFGSVRLEGFLVPYQQLHVSETTGFGSVFSGGAYGSGSFTAVTTQVEDTSSAVLRGMAARYLEDIGLVAHAGTEVGIDDGLVLRGQIITSGSWWNAWSAPVNLVTALALVLPVTWASEVQCSLRVYARDGEFLKAYDSGIELVRSWHHWAGTVRVRAGNERRAEGGFLAVRSVLDAFARDALAGEFDAGSRVREVVPRELPRERVALPETGEDPLIRAALGRP